MTEFKLVISDPKTGKSYIREAKDNAANALKGVKIGGKISGEKIELSGYEFEITGGSDNCGFPMRKDVEGSARKKVLIIGGVGFKSGKRKGMKKRRTVVGNTIGPDTSQVNLKILKYGKGKLEIPAPKQAKPEEKTEKKEVKEKAEGKKEEAKPKEKKHENKEEVKEDKPKEEEKPKEESKK